MYMIVDLAGISCAATQPDCVIRPDVQDDMILYDWKAGRGGWIKVWMERMEKYAISMFPPAFDRPSNVFFKAINTNTFSYIRDEKARNLLTRFTNQYYRGWKEKHVKVPPFEQLRREQRGYCTDCPEGWNCPMTRSVAENARRQFICTADCSDYEHHLAMYMDGSVIVDYHAIDALWIEFRDKDQGVNLPAWHPVWLNPNRPQADVDALVTAPNGMRKTVSPIAPRAVTELL